MFIRLRDYTTTTSASAGWLVDPYKYGGFELRIEDFSCIELTIHLLRLGFRIVRFSKILN